MTGRIAEFTIAIVDKVMERIRRKSELNQQESLKQALKEAIREIRLEETQQIKPKKKIKKR